MLRHLAAPGSDLSRNHALLLLAVASALGVVLRTHRIGLDLWLDEIATVVAYSARPLLEIFGSYQSPGNHLLNSLLVRLSTSAFGESEWSVRLAAVVFGVATIPLMYWAGRLAMSRAASVGAALLLAVSYHHIFFSQNARGYTAHLFSVLASSALLASALRKDHLLKWVAYVLAMTLGFAALMTTAFTLAGHMVVGAIALIAAQRRGAPLLPLAGRLFAAFGATGLLALQVYAVSIPDVIAVYPTVYGSEASGYALLSREFASQLMRGVSAGFALGFAAIPLIAVAFAGFVVLMRRNWVLALSLFLSVGITVLYLLVRGQTIVPRLMLPGLPLAILSCMATIEATTQLLARRGLFSRLKPAVVSLAIAVLLSGVSLLALPRYYSAPKQPYRSAIRHLEKVRGEDNVFVIFPGVGGFRYYLGRESVSDTAAYHYVSSVPEYAAALDSIGAADAFLTTTLFRVMRTSTPDLAERIEREWVPVRQFRGTLGDGTITVWRRRSASSGG